MKKHILGSLIFGLIVAVTWIGYAYFYAPPIPQIVEFDTVRITNAKPTGCFPRLKNRVSMKVENIGYLLDENKLTAKIRLNWNGESAPPVKIYVNSEIFKSDKIETDFRDSQVFDAPFKNGNEAEVIIESDVSNWKGFDQMQNYYAAFDVSENDADGAEFSAAKKKGLAQPIVIVHGKSSVIKK